MEDAVVFTSVYGEELYSIPAPVTVVISTPWNEITEEQRMLLSKILGAVKQSLESVRVIYQKTFDLSGWNEKPARILAFVEPPKGVSCYEIVPTGETSVIFSDPLQALNADDAAKRKLWNSLKTLFTA